MDQNQKSQEVKKTAGKPMSPREAAARKVEAQEKAKNAAAKIYERSRSYPLFCCILMWAGVVIGLVSWFPSFTIFGGITNGALGIPGGVMALAGVILMMCTIRCPACGEKKLGRGMGVKVPHSCECPECHAKVNLK